MDRHDQHGYRRGRHGLPSYGIASAFVMALLGVACRSHHPMRIAVIPRTSGIPFWERVHGAADDAADRIGAFIYWNAPTSEDDVEGQITLVERVVSDDYQGLVLAPDQALSLITPVRRALSRGIATVIIGSPLPIPAGGNLSYILNDEEEGGRLAAQRVARLLHDRGSVALLGINPDVSGIMIRARSFEQTLARNYPDIHIVEKRMGSFNVPHEQQVVQDTLTDNPNLDVIVALMWTTAHETLSALDTSPQGHPPKVIGFDPGARPPFHEQCLDSVILQDTRAMGQQAVELIHARLLGQSVPELVTLPPKLITRENVDSPEVRHMTALDWRPGRQSRNAVP